jgi:hypothetical protein
MDEPKTSQSWTKASHTRCEDDWRPDDRHDGPDRGPDPRRFGPGRTTTADRLIQIAIDAAVVTAITAGVLLTSAPWVLR